MTGDVGDDGGKLKEKLHIETPLIKSLQLSRANGFEVYLKLENVQVPGSFKIRGVGKFCVDALQQNPNVECFVCASGGNAGLAAGYAGMLLGKPVYVYVPAATPQHVLDKFSLYQGCKVEAYGEVWNKTNLKAKEFCESANGVYVHPYDHPLIWEGHSTMIDEMVSQLGEDCIPSCIVVSVGGGGLLLGVLEGVKKYPKLEKVPVVVMETVGADCLSQSIKAGKVVRLDAITSIAKSLGALEPSAEVLNRVKGGVNLISKVVTDEIALDASKQFANDHRYLVEPACGAALSTVYSGILTSLHNEGLIDTSKGPAVIIVCGGVNIPANLQS